MRDAEHHHQHAVGQRVVEGRAGSRDRAACRAASPGRPALAGSPRARPAWRTGTSRALGSKPGSAASARRPTSSGRATCRTSTKGASSAAQSRAVISPAIRARPHWRKKSSGASRPIIVKTTSLGSTRRASRVRRIDIGLADRCASPGCRAASGSSPDFGSMNSAEAVVTRSELGDSTRDVGHRVGRSASSRARRSRASDARELVLAVGERHARAACRPARSRPRARCRRRRRPARSCPRSPSGRAGGCRPCRAPRRARPACGSCPSGRSPRSRARRAGPRRPPARPRAGRPARSTLRACAARGWTPARFSVCCAELVDQRLLHRRAGTAARPPASCRSGTCRSAWPSGS